MNPSKRTITGVSLIEVLFALFVLSVGLLGIAGLQITAKRSNFEAVQRSTATMLANDIVERMRANPVALGDYLGAVEPVLNQTPVTVCTSASPCAPQQLAARDLYEWHQAILGATDQQGTANTGGLVSPSACITNPAPNVYTITIAWRGQTALTYAGQNNCGSVVNYGTNDEYRRILEVSIE